MFAGTKVLSVASFLFATVTAPAVAAASAHAGVAQPPPPYGWPELLHDTQHTSVSPETTLSTASAPTLGIWWMAPMRSADLGSPVTAYNATLKKTVVYVGTERGDVIAFDEANGTTLWSTSVGYGDSMRATPMIAPDGSVWVATAYGSTLWKLDGTTGAVVCSAKEKIKMDASPQFATPPGGVPSVFFSTNHTNTTAGPEVAVRQDNCKQIWSFTKYLTSTGVWVSAAYGADATGKGRVYFGTADPDSTVYALDANTGKEVWHYSTLNPPNGIYDIGAAATVSPPGNNGFKDGVLYVESKYGILYALDLTTGKPIWNFNFNKQGNMQGDGISSTALYGKTLVYGVANGLEAVDAVTGKLIWHHVTSTAQNVISSPAVVGPKGKEIVVYADAGGVVRVSSLANGNELYTYQTLNYITASPSIINGHIQIASTDGFLYDFAVNAYNPASPKTVITSPATGSTVQNPNGNLTVSGTASDPVGVTEVIASVQSGGPTGPWYDAATNTWNPAPINNYVAVASPGATSTKWNFSYPVPLSGSTYQVSVNAVDLLGQVDRTGAITSFTVSPNPQSPHLTLSTSVVAPSQSFSVYGSAFRGGETVKFTLQGNPAGSAVANQNGFVPKTTIKVPATDAFGPSALTATGQTSGKSTTAAVDITNVWKEGGFDAAHSAYEPNDSILAQTLQATGGGYLSRAWYYTTAGAVDSAPSIVAGAAYVGDATGQFSSVDTASGAPFWTYKTPGGAAVHGAPAIDGANVYFGAADGNLYALANSTGTLSGTVKLDGVPTSPIAFNNNVYVATDNGTVFDINEKTGTTTWSVSVGAAVHVPPTLDAARGILFVGNDGGQLAMLNASTGASLGTLAIGSPVTTAPMLSGGTIFVGSSDGTLRTYAESTGTPGWTYASGAPIHALSATGTNVYAGNDNGSLAYLQQSTGRTVFVTTFTSAIVGMASTFDVPIVELSDGTIGAIKDDQGGRIAYEYKTKAGLSSAPAIVDGTVYVGAEDGGLYAFDNHGQPPQSIKEHLLLKSARTSMGTPVHWTNAHASGFAASVHAFAPIGPRDYALHVDRTAATPGQNAAGAANAVRTYVLAWGMSPADAQRVATTQAGVIATAVDRSPLPRSFDDASVQRALARAIDANGWRPGPNVQFVVATPSSPASAMPYCAYHSAFRLHGPGNVPVVYGVVAGDTHTHACGTFAAQLERLQSEMRGDPFAQF